jgi:hypothetical protein
MVNAKNNYHETVTDMSYADSQFICNAHKLSDAEMRTPYTFLFWCWMISGGRAPFNTNSNIALHHVFVEGEQFERALWKE